MQSISAVGPTANLYGVAAASAPDISSMGNYGWEKLTADDWNIMSAMAGKDLRAQLAILKPGECPLLPSMAADLLNVRNRESLPSGQNFSPQFFKGRLDAAGSLMDPDDRTQLERAYAYTMQRDSASRASYVDVAAGRVNIYA